MLIDTHCHLTDPAFDQDRDPVLARMREAGVERAVVIESVTDRLPATLAWAADTDGVVVATGCHPHDASHWSPALRERMVAAWSHPLVRAAGEMGLDYHYDHAPRDVQRRVFAEQLALAGEAGKPVIIHAREADDDVAEALRDATTPVVLHSFSSGDGLAQAGLAAGWYFSFSGMITFKSWERAELVRAIPADRLLLETDAPYLAPVPHRGRRNEPAFTAATAARLAAVRGTPVGEIARCTSRNALRLFWPEASVPSA